MLTAIVISFGVLAFAVVLIKRAYKVIGADDMNEMKSTDSQL
ncbi:NADH-quinone oxidoreductase subunit K [Vibrio genomosp. F10]|nr:NADH-quinone oxidoreductase subunit K [Vibrio genomosp. F10]